VADIPGLTGMTAVVTGANRGIGLEVTRGLPGKGAQVVLAVRRPVTVAGAGLADQQRRCRRRFAAAHRRRFRAGLRANHLGHFALTGLPLPALTGPPTARVVTAASLAHARGHIDFGNLDASQGYPLARVYAQSKLANLLPAYELQRRLSAARAGLLCVAAHPGWAATETEIRPPGERQRLLDDLGHMLTRHLAATPAQGARPILFAATSPQVRGGDYIGPAGRSGWQARPGPVR
jgi:NAD(P)-dependent dehydrogenase (short-subunit alcohol dehydrogenase family)